MRPQPGQTLNQEHFDFGENWRRFLAELDDERISQAEISLKRMLEVDDLIGKSFLDIGSGSGLFSLGARRLGARVHSFDYDPESVKCTAALKRQYFPDDDGWTVEVGSVLDANYMKSLGHFDVVYAWGVLHHTGALWESLGNVLPNVAQSGLLYIAIYNDQGRSSRYWKLVKQTYNRLPRGLRFLVLGPAYARLWGPTTIKDLLRGKPFKTWRSYRERRGMSPRRDVTDWVGGYPFEVAKPEQIFDFCRTRGFMLTRLVTQGGGHGNNEFVFLRVTQ